MTTHLTRTAVGGLLSLTLSLGSLSPMVATAATLTRTSAFDYDASSGLLTKEIIEPGNSNFCLVTTYTIDSYGNRTAATTRNCNGSTGSAAGNSEAAAPAGDPVIASRTTSSTFDARGQFATSSSNALGQSETKVVDARFGTVTSLTGPNGLTTTWAYDDFGRKTLETRADGTQTKWDYLYCTGYNGGSASCPTVGGAAGTWVLVTTPLASDGVTQTGPISKTYYDALNREIRSETQGFDGSGASTAIYKDTQYDSLGRPYKTSRPYYSGQTVYWATVTYDAIGRAVQITDADGAITSTAYNGLVTTVTNPNNQTRITTKNSQGQVVSVKDALNQVLTYAYDPFGNLLQTIDPLGNSTALVYDLRGRKTQMIDPDMGTWTYSYNALGQLVKQTDAKGQASTLSYDLLGRLTTRSESDLISTWYYDTYKGGGACAKGIGKLCQSETSTGYVRISAYDSLGRPSTTTTTIDTTYSASVSYDSQGRVASQTYPGGKAVKYVYTTLGYLKELRDVSTNALYWQASTLDAEGHLLLQTYGNGVQTTQSYNASNGRLTAIQAGAGNGVQNFTYQYDSLGNITTRTDANDSLSETFLYDSLNRLTSATVNSSGAGIVTTTYGYSGIGNINSKSDLGTYTYNPSGGGSVRPHAVTQVNFTAGGYRSYQYDANGNLTTESQYDASNTLLTAKGRTEVYTSFNMPQAMGSVAVTSSFYYGPEHQRVKQLSSVQGTTIYLNPGNNGDLNYEKDIKPNGSVEQRSFLTAYGQVIGVIKQISAQQSSTTQVRYFHRDNLGSTTTVTDETGTVVERLAYEPFGKRRFANGTLDPSGAITPLTTDRGYTNHEHIDELGLIHMNGRIYDPVIGRFMSADPQIQSPGELQSYNRYSYVTNNPLMYKDPSGFSRWTDFRDSVTNFGRNPSPRNALNLIHNLPGQAQVDQYVMTHQWAYAAGQWAATYFTAICGGCGGAAWSTYYGYQATGSMNAAFKTGALTYATTYAFSYVDSTYGKTWNPERVLMTSLVGGVTTTLSGGKFSDGFMGSFWVASLTYANVLMSADQTRKSAMNPDNLDTSSDCKGFNGGSCIAGARHECLDGNLCDPAHRENYLPCDSQAGGCQGGVIDRARDAPHHLGPIPCGGGTVCQGIAEAFAGPHDWLRENTGFSYDGFGNSRHFTGIRLMLDNVHLYGSIPIAAPFAAAGLVGTTPGGMVAYQSYREREGGQ